MLGALRRRWGLVTVVSGRPVAFLATHLGPSGARLVGLYGLEQAAGAGAAATVLPEIERWRDVVTAAADEIAAGVPDAVVVERKGLTVTVHFRAVPDTGPQVAQLVRRVADRRGLAAHPGKMSLELRPPLDVDKGTVIAGMAHGLHAAFFAGDDTGDLPAFAAMAELRRQGVATLAVAVAGTETPAEVAGAADLTVASPAELVRLLRRLT